MRSRTGAPASPESPTEAEPARRDRAFPVLAFVAVAIALFAVAGLSAAANHYGGHPVYFPGRPWIDAWVRWDAGWYGAISQGGYWLKPGQQSPVVFFPGYPLLMRAITPLVANSHLAGMLTTFASGLGAAVLFHRWCRQRLGWRKARAAVVALLVYPFAFYLVATVYSDAMFLVAALAAFALLEEDRPWLAGLAGAIATATRPVGPALVAGLWLRALQRRGVLSVSHARAGKDGSAPARGRLRLDLRRLAWRDAGLLLAPLGLLAYSAFLWRRFGDPFAYAGVQGVSGWDQAPGPATWLKLSFFRALADIPPLRLGHVRIVTHALFVIPALALVPRAFRRFGWAYGIYALAVLALPLISSKDFTGIGRYALAAFPCFAVVPDLLESRPRLARAALAASALLLIAFTSVYAQAYYMS